jgi:Cytochrome C and Quinol oxidase polypeptide I
MDRPVIYFLKASLLWLALGVSLGVAMAVHPAWVIYRPVHLHLLLLGFVTMMISGVAYHVFPRFAATPLHAPRLMAVHLGLANAGLVLVACGFVARAHAVAHAPLVLGLGGSLSAAGAYLLGWNLWRTLDKAAIPPSRLAPARPMQVVEVPGRR